MPRRRVAVLAGFILAIAAGFGAWRALQPSASASGEPPPAPAVPVDVATAVRTDVPVYLRGLGTVQAYNSVTVRSRVDGELVRIGFVEGQDVKTGDVLAEIGIRRSSPMHGSISHDSRRWASTNMPRARASTRRRRWFASSKLR